MRPLRKGTITGAIAAEVQAVFLEGMPSDGEASDFLDSALTRHDIEVRSARVAQIIGGALEQAFRDTGNPPEILFRYFTDNLWRLVRSLRASGLLLESK